MILNNTNYSFLNKIFYFQPPSKLPEKLQKVFIYGFEF